MSRFTDLERACNSFLDITHDAGWRVEGEPISRIDLLDALNQTGLTLIITNPDDRNDPILTEPTSVVA